MAYMLPLDFGDGCEMRVMVLAECFGVFFAWQYTS